MVVKKNKSNFQKLDELLESIRESKKLLRKEEVKKDPTYSQYIKESLLGDRLNAKITALNILYELKDDGMSYIPITHRWFNFHSVLYNLNADQDLVIRRAMATYMKGIGDEVDEYD